MTMSQKSYSDLTEDVQLAKSTLTAFVSGHMDLTPGQFEEYYHSKLDKALAEGHRFIMGDAKGVDAESLRYLLSPTNREKYPDIGSRIIIYCSRPRNIPLFEDLSVQVKSTHGKYDPKNPRSRHLDRDAMLTEASDYDILWVRDEKESKALYQDTWRADRISATELNRRRRAVLPRNIYSMSLYGNQESGIRLVDQSKLV